MPYLTNPIYLSGGFAGQTDAVAAFGQNFAQALTDLKALSPSDVAAVRAQVLTILNAMPSDVRAQHLSLSTKVEQALNQSNLQGLGDPISGTLGTIASIASIVASLGGLTVGVVGMVQAHKQAKAAQNQANQAAAANTALVAAQTQQIQAQTASLTKPAGATAAKTSSSSSIPTLAASLVAGAGAFFLAR